MPKVPATCSDGFIHSIREKGSPVKPKFEDVTQTYVSENVENKKFYLTKIEKVSADSTGSESKKTIANPNSSADTVISISNIFDFVNKNDVNFERDSKSPVYFNPKPVNSVLLNTDGTPKLFYFSESVQDWNNGVILLPDIEEAYELTRRYLNFRLKSFATKKALTLYAETIFFKI